MYRWLDTNLDFDMPSAPSLTLQQVNEILEGKWFIFTQRGRVYRSWSQRSSACSINRGRQVPFLSEKAIPFYNYAWAFSSFSWFTTPSLTREDSAAISACVGIRVTSKKRLTSESDVGWLLLDQQRCILVWAHVLCLHGPKHIARCSFNEIIHLAFRRRSSGPCGE